MATLDDIQKKLDEMAIDGVTKLTIKGAVKALPELLQPTETVVALVPGAYMRKRGIFREPRSGILAATNTRLVFVAKKMLGGTMFEDIQYGHVTGITFETGWMHGKITISTANSNAVMKDIQKQHVAPFVTAAEAARSEGSIPID